VLRVVEPVTNWDAPSLLRVNVFSNVFFFFCGACGEWMEVDGGYNGETFVVLKLFSSVREEQWKKFRRCKNLLMEVWRCRVVGG